jgi:hypothetical protein
MNGVFYERYSCSRSKLKRQLEKGLRQLMYEPHTVNAEQPFEASPLGAAPTRGKEPVNFTRDSICAFQPGILALPDPLAGRLPAGLAVLAFSVYQPKLHKKPARGLATT